MKRNKSSFNIDFEIEELFPIDCREASSFFTIFIFWTFFGPKFKMTEITKIFVIERGFVFPTKSRIGFPIVIHEPRHDKTNKMSVRPAKTQISLGIRPV